MSNIINYTIAYSKNKRSNKNKDSEDSKKKRKYKRKAILSSIIGIGSALALNKTRKDENFTGIKRLYHGTDADAVESIKQNGILGKYGSKPDSYTKQVLKDIPSNKLDGLVYLGKSKRVSKSVMAGRKTRLHKKQKLLDIRIPLKDYNELIHVPNPELRGAKNSDEYARKMIKSNPLVPNNGLVIYQLKNTYDLLSDKGTDVIKGDIKSKYIKGGKGYKPVNLTAFKYNMKNNPKFARSASKVGLATVGTIAGLGLGEYYGYKYYKHRKLRNKKLKKLYN